MISKRHATLFPKEMDYLEVLGENIILAMKRRKLSKVNLSERTNLSRTTVTEICKGSPKVSLGHYMSVLSILGLSESIKLVAAKDELGQKLQEIRLLKGRSR